MKCIIASILLTAEALNLLQAGRKLRSPAWQQCSVVFVQSYTFSFFFFLNFILFLNFT